MKTFEEKFTAWVDGQLTGKELADFEASLPNKAVAEEEKRSAKKLGAFLKRELATEEMSNAEFFSHQVSERIARESAQNNSHPSAGWWTLPRLVWSAATALAIFAVFAIAITREQNTGDQSDYLTQILNARVDPSTNPNATVTMFETGNKEVTVLWTEGLQSLPADYAAK